MDSLQIQVNPFVKWAGGKRQILSQIERYLPLSLLDGKISTYIEPFIGGGAVFFYLVSNFSFSNKIIIDINPDLILLYKTIQKNAMGLVLELRKIEQFYLKLSNDDRRGFFYKIRSQFNEERRKINYSVYDYSWVIQSSLFIFLNRTCFNGLYRVNSAGEFNVPFGSYKNPKIFDQENIERASKLLEDAFIICGDFSVCLDYADDKTFLYFDPPYRPISDTSSFTSYTKENFNDDEQIRLANLCRELSEKGAKFLLSNSDPKNINDKDNFFENLYSGFQIKRISARRNISSNGFQRGFVEELLIMNYSDYNQ